MREISTGQFNPLKIRTVVFLFLDFTSNLSVLLLFWKCFSLKCMEISDLGKKKKAVWLTVTDIWRCQVTIFPEPFISIKTRGMCYSAVLIVAAPLAQVWLCDVSLPGLCNSWWLIQGASLAVSLGVVASAPGTFPRCVPSPVEPAEQVLSADRQKWVQGLDCVITGKNIDIPIRA